MAKRNPFNDESDDKSREANEAAVAKVRERATAPDEEVVRVDVADRDDDDAAPDRSETPEQRESRAARRSNRYKEQKEARERAESELSKLREELAAQRAERAAEQAVARMAPPWQQQQPQSHPLDREIDVTQRELNNVRMEYRRLAGEGKLSQEDVEGYNKKAEELDRKVNMLHVQKATGGQRPGPDPVAAARQATLEMMYPDIMGDQIKQDQATLNARILMRERGVQAATPDIIREAVEKTREQFGMKTGTPKRSGPSEGMRAKFGGAGAGSSGGGGGGGPQVVEMGVAERRMARALYPNKPEAEAFKLWASKVGSKRDSAEE